MAEFHKDQAGWDQVLRAKDGVVGKHLEDKSVELVLLAKMQVGKKTLALMNSISYRMESGPDGLMSTVYSDNPIALLHHQGTSHEYFIDAKPGKTMRFEHRGRIVYAKRVRHPIVKPNRYLTDNLRKVIN
jgi:hypothetical protein